MIVRHEDLCFSTESRESLDVRRKGIRRHLQRIVSLERRVMRSLDLAHDAFAEEGYAFYASGHAQRALSAKSRAGGWVPTLACHTATCPHSEASRNSQRRPADPSVDTQNRPLMDS
jgi:hypothetical protein